MINTIRLLPVAKETTRGIENSEDCSILSGEEKKINKDATRAFTDFVAVIKRTTQQLWAFRYYRWTGTSTSLAKTTMLGAYTY